MLVTLHHLLTDRSAATAIEYAVLAAAIAVAAVGALTTVGQKVSNMLGPAANALG